MEITTTTINRPGRRAAVNALAIVGFIALVVLGIALAIYTARYAPKLASRLGAGVSLSSIFHPNDEEPTLNVVTATSSLPFGETATSSLPDATASSTDGSASGSQGSGSGGTVTKTTTVVTTTTVAPYGDPDLTVNITAVGYLRRDGDTDTFVADRTIDNDNDGAVKFTVKNVGTNVTGSWKFKVEVPSNPSQTFTSPTQRSLNPGDSVDYVLGFEKPREGDGREITVTVDSGKDVRESNESNNEDSEEIDIDN